MIYLIVTFTAVLLTISLRHYLIRQFYPDYPDRDEISHFILVEAIKENRGKIPKRLEQYLLYKNSYPNGFHRLIALSSISKEQLEKIGRYIPVLCECLLLLVTGWFLYYQNAPHPEWLLLYPTARIFWNKKTSLFFGERAFGTLCGNAYFIFSVLAITHHNPAFYALAFLFFTLTACSSVFGNQALLFITLLMSFITQNPTLLYLYLACLGGSLIISRGYVYTVFESQIKFSWLYATFSSPRCLKDNFYKNALLIWNKFRFSAFTKEFFENPIYMTISNMPLNVAFFILFYQSDFMITSASAIVLSGIMLNLLISTETLKFLGQPDRYMEYTIPFLFLYLSHHALTHHVLITVSVLAINAWGIKYHLKINEKWSNANFEQEKKDYNELLDYLNQEPETIILPIPLKVSNFLVYSHNKHRYVSYFINPESYVSVSEFTPDLPPYPGQDIPEYIDRFKFNMIIAHKKSVEFMDKRYGNGEPYYDFSGYKNVLENTSFKVFKVK